MYSSNGTDMSPYHNSSTNNWTKEEHNTDYYNKYVRLETSQSLRIVSIVVSCLVCVLGLVGNGVVIWVTGFKMKKKVNTVLFLNLAVADFLFTGFLPVTITMIAMDFHWPFGRLMCKLLSTISFLNMFGSIYFLVVISVVRCVSVVCLSVAKTHRSVRKASWLSLDIWLFTLLLSLHSFVFMDTVPANNNETINCLDKATFIDVNRSAAVTRTIIVFLLGFVVPFVIIVSCYAVIIHRIKRSRSMSGRTGRPFKIITVVITAFFLCWAPVNILVILMLFHNRMSIYGPNTRGTTMALSIAMFLAYFNSCLNPLLYIFMGQDFKNKMRKSVLKVLETAFTGP